MLKIANIEFRDKPLFLAPMEDVTDASFRHLCKLFGADMVYTEFVSSDGLIRASEKTIKKMALTEGERPIGIQLYGHLTDAMVEAAKIATTFNPDLIDINCGCPVRKIAHRGAGAGLLQNIPHMVSMAEAIVKSTILPVTVKTRLGWDDHSKNILETALRLQDIGIKALVIHGRTRAQLYKGPADWSLIGEVKNHPRIHIPIIGNGDITSASEAAEAFKKYGVDAIMIGRGAIGRPWVFREIRQYLDQGTLPSPLSVKEKSDLALIHLRKSVEVKGHPRGILEMRRHLINYFKGLPHFKEYRLTLVTTLELMQLEDTIAGIGERYGGDRFEDSPQVSPEHLP